MRSVKVMAGIVPMQLVLSFSLQIVILNVIRLLKRPADFMPESTRIVQKICRFGYSLINPEFSQSV